MPDEDGDLMLCRIGPDGNEVIGGYGLGYDFAADLYPEWNDAVFEDRPPTDPGLWVWEGTTIVSGPPEAPMAKAKGRWRKATPIDLLYSDEMGDN